MVLSGRADLALDSSLSLTGVSARICLGPADLDRLAFRSQEAFGVLACSIVKEAIECPPRHRQERSMFNTIRTAVFGQGDQQSTECLPVTGNGFERMAQKCARAISRTASK